MAEFDTNDRTKDKVQQALSRVSEGVPISGGVLSALQALGLVVLGPHEQLQLTDQGRHYLALGPFAPPPGSPVPPNR